MKKIFGFYTKSPLILRIAIGLVIGVCLGLWVPQASFVTVFGDIFVGALKAIAPLLVFVLVVASLASAGQGLGRRFRTVTILYMLSTFLAAVVAVAGSYMFKVKIPLEAAAEQSAPAGLGEVFKTLLSNMVMNPVAALMNANYIGILTWSVILGLALRVGAGEKTKAVLTDVSNAVIVDFLLAGGVTQDEITVSVPQISDKLANEYGDNNRAFRYIAKNVVTVCTSDVDKVLALMSSQADLLKKGVVVAGNDWENPVEFKYEGLNEIKPQMIEEATRNARETAQKFAQDSDSSLGKIKTANQGTFTIGDRDSNTPYIKRVRVVTSVTYYLKN